MAVIKTFLGDLKVEAVIKTLTGYYAITGNDLMRRSWTLSKKQYDQLKETLEKEKGGEKW